MTTVLLLGATGYVGGTFLVALRSSYPSLKISALVRSPAQFDAVSSAGATPIQGDFSEHDKLSDLAEHADIVVNAAKSDDFKLTEALIKGLKRRKESRKGVGALIQISGAAMFIQPGEGKWEEGVKIWDDLSETDMKAIAPPMYHGEVDSSILKAGDTGEVNSYILCPTAVHGPGVGPVGRASSFFTVYLGVVLKLKGVVLVGEGTNRTETVHIDDLTSLFLLIFAHALSSLTSDPTPPLTAYQKYFIGSTGVLDWNALAGLVSGAVSRSTSEKVKEAVKDFEPKKANPEDIGPFVTLMTCNLHTRPGRGKTLGWEPNAPKLEETIDGDISAALAAL